MIGHHMNQCLIKLLRCGCLFAILLSGCFPVSSNQGTSIPPALIPSQTISPTRSPEPTRTLFPTEVPLPTEESSVLKECTYYQQSPSGIWLLYDCGFDPDGKGAVAVLYNLLTRESQTFTYCSLANLCSDQNAFSESAIQAKAWSPDRNYLYLVLYSGADGGTWFNYVSRLVRVNLHNGYASILLNTAAVIEFSPGMDQLAYIPYPGEEPHVIHIRDLKTLDDFGLMLEPEHEDAGDIVWSPDGSQLIFTAVKYGGTGSSTLMLVDVPKRSRTILIRDYPGFLRFQEWLPGGLLQYRSDLDDTKIIQYSIPENKMSISTAP
jgi:hypothetical protein